MSNVVFRPSSDFRPVKQYALSPRGLGRSACVLGDSIANRKPVLLKAVAHSGIDALTAEWEAFVATDVEKYQMGNGKGKRTLSDMWNENLRLEHDLHDDAEEDNPVHTFMSSA
eukprot:770783-Prymnesium_polylepis.1